MVGVGRGVPRAVGVPGPVGVPGAVAQARPHCAEREHCQPVRPLFVSLVPEVSSSPGDEGTQAQSSQWTQWSSPDLSPLGSET